LGGKWSVEVREIVGKNMLRGGGRENWLSYGSEPQLTAGISQKALLTIPRKLAGLNEIDAQQQHIGN